MTVSTHHAGTPIDGNRTSAPGRRTRGDRAGVMIVAAATVVGVWFGLAGPSESPVVTPPAGTQLITDDPGTPPTVGGVR